MDCLDFCIHYLLVFGIIDFSEDFGSGTSF